MVSFDGCMQKNHPKLVELLLEKNAEVNLQKERWAMGYYMNKSYEFPESPYHETFPYTVVDMVVGMLILTILCVIFVIFFFLTFYACKKALSMHDGYQSCQPAWES